MKVEVNYRWLSLLISLIILVIIRENLVALTIYVTLFITGFTAWLIVLPKMADAASERLQKSVLRALTEGRPEDIHVLITEQRVISWSGRGYLLSEARGLAYSSQEQHERAVISFREALRTVPEEGRPRVQLNMAHGLMKSGALDDAEAMYRSVLSKQPDNMMAEEGLLSISELRSRET
jgi:tetratricopeptide (TPR) repeat protein